MPLWLIWSSKNSFTYKKETLKTGIMTPLSSRTIRNYLTLFFWAKIRKGKNWKNGNKITSCLRKGSIRVQPLWTNGKTLGTIRPQLGIIHKGLSRSVTLWRAAIKLWNHRQTMTKSLSQVRKTMSFPTILIASTIATLILDFWKTFRKRNENQKWWMIFSILLNIYWKPIT